MIEYHYMRRTTVTFKMVEGKVTDLREISSPKFYHLKCWPRVVSKIRSNPYAGSVHFQEVKTDAKEPLELVCDSCKRMIEGNDVEI